jgi:hypothetical protein
MLNGDNRYLISILNKLHQDNTQIMLGLVASNRETIQINDLLVNLNNSNNEIQNTIIGILREAASNNNNNNNLNSNTNSNNRATTGRSARRDNIYYTIFDNTLSNSTSDNELTSLLQNFLNPIEVHPTQTQIEQATRVVRYCDIVSPVNDSCPISLNRFNDTDLVSVIRHCGHIFNTSELNTWFTTNCKCPVCRYDIRSYVPINTYRTRPTSLTQERRTTNTISRPIRTLVDALLTDISGNNLSSFFNYL